MFFLNIYRLEAQGDMSSHYLLGLTKLKILTTLDTFQCLNWAIMCVNVIPFLVSFVWVESDERHVQVVAN